MERGLFGIEQSDMQAAPVDIDELTDVIPEDTALDIPRQSLEDELTDLPEDTVSDTLSDKGSYDLDELPEDTAGDMQYEESVERDIEIPEDDNPDVATPRAGGTYDVSRKLEGLPEDVGKLEKEPPKEIKTDQDIYKTVDEALDGTSKKEKELYDSFPVHSGVVDDRPSLKRDDLEPFTETGEGECNLDLMQEGKAPQIDGEPIELHHIGQKMDSPVAELTEEEHRGAGNDAILHDKTKHSEIDRNEFAKEKDHYWRARTQEILQDEIEKGDQA